MEFLIFYFDRQISKIFVETKNPAGEIHTTLSTPNNFVGKDELVAQLVEAPSPEAAGKLADPNYHFHFVSPLVPIKFGSGIQFDNVKKCYRAKQYGFIALDNLKGMHLLFPLQINKEKTKAYFLAHATNTGKMPTYNDVAELLAENNIVTPVSQSIVGTELTNLSLDANHIGRILIAESHEPINGRAEYFTLLVDTKKKAGKILKDGSIDFHEQNSIIQVTKGEEILMHYPEIKADDGTDIYGAKIAATVEKHESYQKGDNIVPSDKNPDLLVSSIDGVLELNKGRVDIKAVLTINGDVNYEKGNIEFKGAVLIKGNVHAGFSVKATGDITIEESVDDAHIETDGNITVKMGISGKGSTIIKAGGNINAKFILNSHVEALGDITIDDSIINSKVFSNQKVSVTSQHGKILGGETIALKQIESTSVGSDTVSNTILTVGRNLELERELETVRPEMLKVKDEIRDIMNKLNTTFGPHLFEDPKKFISALPDFRKKTCIELLTVESKLSKRFKELTLQYNQIEQKLVLKEEPYVIVKDKIHPGSTLNIKKSTFKVDNEIVNAKFFESAEEKAIKYMPVA